MRQQKFRGNVFVANLPKACTDAELAEEFDSFGLVLGAFIARDPDTGVSKGHALVSIAPERAAANAVAALNGKEMGGRRIEVRPADPAMALNIPAPRGRPAQPPRPAWTAPTAPRPAPTFQLERRPLPRRY